MVGEVSFPESAYLALGEPERHALADLLAFGAAVAGGRVDELGSPLVDREVLLSSLENMPYHLGADAIGYDEMALRAAYEDAPEWELDVRHVVRVVEAGAPRALRDSARAVASRVAAAASAGDDFAALAATYSEEPGADQRGGLLDPGRRGTWVEPFWNAALSLRPGETSGVVESDYGFHVLRLDDRRPVPFGEADRGALLRRVVPPNVAAREMDDWLAARDPVRVDEAATDRAVQGVLDGSGVPDVLLIASNPGGVDFTGADFAAAWAALSGEERRVVEGDPASVRSWLDNEVATLQAAREAVSLGAPADPLTASAAARTWRGRAAYWAETFGFSAGMSDQQIRDAAIAAVLSGGQDTRSARNELRSHRVVLRQQYPVSLPAIAEDR